MFNLQEWNESEIKQWRHISDIESLPTTGHIIVSLNRWIKEPNQFALSELQTGVCLTPEMEVEIIGGHLHLLSLIELNFPVFVDGRAFSQARELRERYDFKGIIRATGEVLRDQLDFMSRCGFNQFILSTEELMDETPSDFRHAYQPEYVPHA